MSLRSCARTLGAICGNDMLERAEALVAEMRIEPRWRQDARQEAVLAELEGRDPRQAVRRFVRDEKTGGMTGDKTYRPTVRSLNDPRYERTVATESAEDGMIRREEQERRETLAGAVLMRLTAREQEITKLRAMGWTQAEIARHFSVHQSTIARACTKIAAKSAA